MSEHASIIVPPVDPEEIIRRIRENKSKLEQELRRIEEAKRVTAETLRQVITF